MITILSKTGFPVVKNGLAETIANDADVIGKTIIVTAPEVVSTNLTIPSTVALKIEKGGILTVASGKVLTINCSLNAGRYQIFAGNGTVQFGNGAVNGAKPEWWGADPTGTAANASTTTEAIQKALDSKATVIDSINCVYAVNNTLSIKGGNGLSWIFGRTGNGYANISWYGTSSKPVIELTGSISVPYSVCVDLVNVSINGKASDAAARATIGLSLGKLAESSYNQLIKLFNSENLQIWNCRVGLMIGNDAFGEGGTAQCDVAHMNFKSAILFSNLDSGLLVNSGNAANILFENVLLSGNGTDPTHDSFPGLNTSGSDEDPVGANAILLSGEVTFIAGSSDGKGTDKPVTADIFATLCSVKINGWWSDCHAKFLYQLGGNTQTFGLTGVRHYEGSMTTSTTLLSIYCVCKIHLINCYFYGDVWCDSGVQGGIISSNTRFVTRSPIGTFKGTAITTAHNLVQMLNDYSCISVGGGDRALTSPTDLFSAITHMSASKVEPVILATSPDVEGSGFGLFLWNSTMFFCINLYPVFDVSNPTEPKFRCYNANEGASVYWGYIITLGETLANPIRIRKKQFSSPTDGPFGLSSFTIVDLTYAS